jgi:hypothetical protein
MGKLARSLQLHAGLPGWTALSLEDALRLIVEIDDAADITGGGQEQDVSGTVKTASGDAIDFEAVIGIGLYHDQYGFQPASGISPTGVMTAAAAPLGSFVGGSGSTIAYFKTDATGRFKVKMTKTSVGADTIWFKAFPVGTIGFDGTAADSVSFDA